MKPGLLAAGRLLRLVATIFASLPSGILSRTAAQRAAWMQRLSRSILRIMGATVRTCGTPPQHGLLVCNHLGYLDVIAIGAICPAVFVAKSEVRSWPVVGALCRIAGTIFVDRTRRIPTAGSVEKIDSRLRAGQLVVLFPEGTSSDGKAVFPFKTALLSVTEDFPCATAAISCELPDGSAAEELCYWRDMVFAPHFWNVLNKPTFTIHLRFGDPHPPYPDRKLAGAELRAEIQHLLTLPVSQSRPAGAGLPPSEGANRHFELGI